MTLAGETAKTDRSSAMLNTDDVDALTDLILRMAEKELVVKGQTRGELWHAQLSA